MKPDAFRTLAEFRIREGRMASDDSIGNNGAFLLPLFKAIGGDIVLSHDKRLCHCTMSIVVSDGEDWDHVSASFPSRCPSWDEMCFVKDLFFEPHEAAMQLHPAKADYVNYHPYCLHIWRPQNKRIPLPPSIFVGPKAEAVA